MPIREVILKFNRLRLPILIALALFFSIVLLCLPQTGTLFQQQLAMLVRAPANQQYWLTGAYQGGDIATGEFKGVMDSYQLAVQRHSDQPDVQLGVAGVAPDQRMILQHLANVSSVDRQNPALIANLLRWMMVSRVSLNRSDLTFRGATQAKSDRPVQSDLSNFIHGAQVGEAQDPDNAYFPMLLAIGLFNSRKDPEALSAMLRAGKKRNWNDYALEETKGVWRIDELANGRQSAILRRMQASMLLLPHLGNMREMARLVVSKAVELERKGKNREACEMRISMARCGALMRLKGAYPVANLAGRAITTISFSIPNGEPLRKKPDGNAYQQPFETYADWMREAGLTGEIEWVRSEEKAVTECKQILDEGEKLSPDRIDALKNLIGNWRLNMILLNNAVWIGLASVIALILKLQKSRLSRESEVSIVFGAIAAAGIISFRGSKWIEVQLSLVQLTESLSRFDSTFPLKRPAESTLNSAHLSTFLLSWAIPVSAIILIGLYGNAQGGDFKASQFIANLMERLPIRGLVVACLFTLVYGITLFQTAKAESATRVAMDQKLSHSGKYFANLTHRNWR